MGHCQFCQAELDVELRWCPRCGREQPERLAEAPARVAGAPEAAETRCPACGAELRAGAHFCPRCGHALQEQSAQTDGAGADSPAQATAQTPLPAVETTTSTALGPSSNQHQVQGTLVFDYGLPATGVIVRVYQVGFAGQDVPLGETKSDAQGQYALSYAVPHGQMPNLQVRVVDANHQEIPISSTRFHAQEQEVLHLVVPASVQPLAPEFQRLSADLERHIGGMGNLSQAQENANRQDLRLLSHTTGWDARLLALAANAATLAQTTGMRQEVLYGLLRAGLPADPHRLALVSPAAIAQALGRANQSSIVSIDSQQLAADITVFTHFARTTRLTLKAAGTPSTYGDLLSISGLTPDQQSAFADLFFSQSSTSDGFWQQAAALGIPTETLNTLKLQGKLAYLTFNSVGLIQKLQQDLGSLEHLSVLVDKDLYTTAAWKQYLTAMVDQSDTEALDTLIPSVYQAKTTTERLELYSADLAQKVRLSFPTHVVARLIEKGDLVVGDAPQVTTVLKNAILFGYQLGRTPLNAFLREHQAHLFQSIAQENVAATTESLRTLHRLYQITPSNESLQAAAKLGMTSAHDIADFEAQDFLDRFGAAFPSPDEARLVYQKAQQVNAVTQHVHAAAMQLATLPALPVLSPSSAVREEARAAIIQHFPALEAWLGPVQQGKTGT